jgi:MoaA/NifB/PqqE/SkfB family radical SAM enzyme
LSTEPAWRVEGHQPWNPARDPRRNVEINVGKACNNRCVFCIDGLPKAEDRSYLPWPEMRAEIDRHAAQGYRSLGFLGGEPTTYPWIVQAVAHARAVGFTRVAVATNATKLRLPHFTDRLVDAGLTRATVSMHGHTPALEDALTRVPGNFEKKRAAIRLLRAHRDRGALADGLSVNLVLNGRNHRHLPRILRFFYEDAGFDDVRVNAVRPEGYAEGDAALCPLYAELVPSLLKAIVLADAHFRRPLTFGGFPLCVLPASLREDADLMRRHWGEYRDLRTSCSVRSDGGDAVPPGAVAVPGSYLQQPKSSAVAFDAETGRARFDWQQRKRQDLKGQPAVCGACRLAPVCEGAWKGYLEIWGDQELRPIA